MQAPFLFRISSQLLSSILGGVTVFCLYYTAQLSDPDIVWYCFSKAVEFGGSATAIIYFQGRYLEQ